jgi:hypothetical protein
MTKKHFEWAAEYIRNAGGAALNPRAMEALTDLFLEFGAHFNVARFTAACEPRKEAK